jgi:glycosyltransferase involved in cell wall biosynthesis
MSWAALVAMLGGASAPWETGAPMERCRRVAITLEQCWHAVPGGTARAALGSVSALERFTDLELVGVSARHRQPPDPSWAPSIEVKQLPLPRLALYEAWHRLRWPDVEHATGRVDVIHATGMAMPPATVPIVVTVHDLAFLRDPSQFTRRGVSFFQRAIDLARRDASVVVCPSQATIDECIEHGFDPAKIRLVQWGIDPQMVQSSAVAEMRARLGISGRYVLWTGTIEPRKNLPVLLSAFEGIEDRDVTLVLAGPEGWNEQIDDQLHRLGSRVARVGFVEPQTLSALQAEAELFIFPSRQEGFGLPVLEAMAQGTAVITSSGTSTEEVVGDCGVVVNPSDVDALRAEIDRLLADDAERDRLGSAGLERATSVFTWEKTASALQRAYEAALS